MRKIWEKNTKEERLLGVSLTGIMDHLVTSDSNDGIAFDNFGAGTESLDMILHVLKEDCIETNLYLSADLGIEQSTAITCIKPSGTVSQLVDSASGIHARFSEYYIRTVRADNKDPLTDFLKSVGVPNEPDVTKPDSTTVFSFPMKSPEGAVTADQLTAISALELWKKYQMSWCEHKPSVTIYVKPNEWLKVGSWVYENFDIVSGVSFLPYSDHVYKQAPYQKITKEEYEKLLNEMPKEIDWNNLSEFEKVDTTAGMQTFACSGDACELVDLT